jgi:hypothetical protein
MFSSIYSRLVVPVNLPWDLVEHAWMCPYIALEVVALMESKVFKN